MKRSTNCRMACSVMSSPLPVTPNRRQRLSSAILAIGTAPCIFLILMLLLRTVYPPARVLRLLARGEGLASCSASGVGSRGCVADLNMPNDGVGEAIALDVGVTGGVEVGGVDSVGNVKPGCKAPSRWLAPKPATW